MNTIIRKKRNTINTTKVVYRLSPQETKISHLIANGLIGKEIADELFISPKTVNTHTRNIRRKTGAKNIADITRKYILSLPKASDVLKTMLFLTIQVNIIINLPTMDLRRGRSGRKVRVEIVNTPST